MALLYLKNIVHPSRDYRRLTEPGSYDLESPAIDLPESSTASRSSICDDQDEKDYNHESSTKTSRFDARLISAATIGFSDGLTVPFALTAGLSALGTSRVVIYGGLSELIAGTISMGMGGYLGAKGEAAAYAATLAETKTLVHANPVEAAELIAKTFSTCELPPALLGPMAAHFDEHPSSAVSFLMTFHHNMQATNFEPKRAYINGMVISGGYVVGGIVPLLPYMIISHVHEAFKLSIVTTAIVLFLFGWAKTAVVGEKSRLKCARGAVEMLLLGGFAAGAAVGCVKMLKS